MPNKSLTFIKMSQIQIFLLAFLLSDEGLAQDRTLVETSSGPMKGFLKDDVNIWLGVPYAMPPLGELRFERPVPFKRVKSVYEAKTQPHACIQLPGEGFLRPSARISEDCLYLNIHAPKNSFRKPVVVWIYGGGYTVGAASIALYDPKVFVKLGEVVFVAIQYRVGSFGFLYTGKEGSGNMGLYDQAMALKWVYDNIKGFGGNPDKITLMGQSAGANSIAVHILSDLSNNYFQKAILQSSGYVVNWGLVNKERAIKRAKTLGKSLGCEDFVHLEDCLRQRDPKLILSQEFNVEPYHINFYPFVPVIDGEIIAINPKDEITQILSGKRVIKEGMSILIGSNANEGYNSLSILLPSIYNQSKELSESERTLSYEVFQSIFQNIFQDYSKPVQREILRQYKNDSSPTFYFRVLDQMVADSSYVCSTEEFAQANSISGNNVFRYFYNHHSVNNPSANWTGAKHGDELEFTFGIPFAGIFQYPQYEKEFGSLMIKLWTDFIHTGTPTPTTKPLYWPTYDPEFWDYMHLRPNKTVLCSLDMFRRCDFWINQLPGLVKKFPIE